MKDLEFIAKTFGIKSKDVKNATIAIKNMKIKGFVSSCDFRGQLCESIPGSFDIACDSMGIDRAKFSFMLENKLLHSENFLKLLNDQIKRSIKVNNEKQ